MPSQIPLGMALLDSLLHSTITIAVEGNTSRVSQRQVADVEVHLHDTQWPWGVGGSPSLTMVPCKEHDQTYESLISTSFTCCVTLAQLLKVSVLQAVKWG